MATPSILRVLPAENAGGVQKRPRCAIDSQPGIPSTSPSLMAPEAALGRTLNTVESMVAAGLDVAPHLSMSGDAPDTVRTLIDRYRDLGIRRIVPSAATSPRAWARGASTTPRSWCAYSGHTPGRISALR